MAIPAYRRSGLHRRGRIHHDHQLSKETMVKAKGKGKEHWYSQVKLEVCIVGHDKIEDCAGLHQA